MKYSVVLSDKARKNLKKLNKTIAAMLVAWIRKNLHGTENPRIHGKALTSNLSGLWRYRVGDYRIIAEIQDELVAVIVIEIGHRREIYD
ncbi:MAG: type II toxin-antitoxin system RelE/ParE family toxin [Acidobacteriota bacterium]|jgi:mRNA interferase RelE/StbE|nr:type II toxin-antitoxin system RelE/ParE family toxin [Acidobacteriota bacterium]